MSDSQLSRSTISIPLDLYTKLTRMEIQNEELRAVQNEVTAELLLIQEENVRLSKELHKCTRSAARSEMDPKKDNQPASQQARTALELELFEVREKLAIAEELLQDMTSQRDRASDQLSKTQTRLSRAMQQTRAKSQSTIRCLRQELGHLKDSFVQMRNFNEQIVRQCSSELEKAKTATVSPRHHQRAGILVSPIVAPSSPPDFLSASSFDFPERPKDVNGAGVGDQALRGLLQYARAQIRDLSSENAGLLEELRGLSLTNASLQSAFRDLAQDTARAFVDMKGRLGTCENALMDVQQYTTPFKSSLSGYNPPTPPNTLFKLNFSSLIKSATITNNSDFIARSVLLPNATEDHSLFTNSHDGNGRSVDLFSAQLELAKALREIELLQDQLSDHAQLARQLDESKSQTNSLQTEMEKLKSQSKHEIQNALDEASARICEMKKSHGAKIAALTQELTQLKSYRAAHERAMTSLQSDLNKSKLDLSESQSEIDRLKRRLRDQIGQSGDFAERAAKEADQKRETEIEEIKGRFVREIQEQREKYLKQLEDQKERFVRSLSEEREAHEEDRAKNEREIRTLLDKLRTMEIRLLKQTTEKSSRDSKSRRMEENWTQTDFAIKKKVECSTQTVVDRKMIGEIRELQKEVFELSEQLGIAQKRQAELLMMSREESARCQKEIDDLRLTNGEMAKICEQCMAEKDRLSAQMDAIQNELASPQPQVKLASSQDILHSIRSSIQTSNQTLTDSLSRIKRKEPSFASLFSSIHRTDPLSLLSLSPSSPPHAWDLAQKLAALKDLSENVRIFSCEYERDLGHKDSFCPSPSRHLTSPASTRPTSPSRVGGTKHLQRQILSSTTTATVSAASVFQPILQSRSAPRRPAPLDPLGNRTSPQEVSEASPLAFRAKAAIVKRLPPPSTSEFI